MNATRPDLFICRALFPYIIVGPMVLFTILLTILSTSGPVQAMPNAADWDDQFFLNGLNGDVYALAIDSQGAVYAGGYFSGADSTTVNNIAKWDGTSWSARDGGVIGGSVRSLAVDSNDDLYVGDFFEAGSGATTANYIAKWDGTSWSALDGGVSGGFVRALAVDSNDDLYVGGYFTTAGGQISMNLGRWFERVFLVYLPIGK